MANSLSVEIGFKSVKDVINQVLNGVRDLNTGVKDVVSYRGSLWAEFKQYFCDYQDFFAKFLRFFLIFVNFSIMIEIERFLLRTNQSKADLLRALGEDPKSSLLSAYASGRSKPSFEMCQK